MIGYPLLPTFVYLLRLVICTLSIAAASAELASYRADIKLVRYGVVDVRMSGEMSFSQQGTEWTLGIHGKGWLTKLSEQSSGIIKDERYLPTHYRKDNRFYGVREKISWSFDWGKKLVSGRVQKKNRSYPLDSIIHDPNSFQMPLRQALLANKTDFETRFLRYLRPETLRFRVVKEEPLNLSGSVVETLLLEQVTPQRQGERKLIWVAKQYGFIPLRFATYKDGKLRDEIRVTRLFMEDQEVSFTTASRE